MRKRQSSKYSPLVNSVRSRSVALMTKLVVMIAMFAGIAFPVPGHADGSQADTLRFVEGVVIDEFLDEASVPEEFRSPTPAVELISISAADAPQPRAPREGRTIAVVDTGDLARKLDVDRLLLAEIRKPVPGDRGEAESYLSRLKQLAGQSDPVRLVPLADRLLDQAPIYFDWLDREFENQDEEVMEYYVGGARGFSFALDNFKTAVMFTVINRLDVASRVIEELDITR